MKKRIVLALSTVIVAVVFAACNVGGLATNPPASDTGNSQVRETVTVTDSNGNQVEITPNPTTVAIFDYGVLDMIYRVGFERTGIELLIVPTKETLPDEFAYFANQSNDRVITGGTLFYVDWDVLDLVQPDLVILGARSFGMNAAGNRLNTEERVDFVNSTLERYGGTEFLFLAHNAQVAQQLVDMQRNVDALALVFPQLADDLNRYMNDIRAQFAEIYTTVSEGEYRALFVSTGSPTNMSVFLRNSRYGMIYDEFGFFPVQDEEIEWTDQHGFDTRAEFVLETNPDVIFLLDRSEVVGTGAGSDNFLGDPIIQMTEAYQNGHIYTLNGVPWYTITVGFTGAEAMINDINRFLEAR